MIRITREISIGPDEIVMEFVRSPGPGGQNVNKVATTAQLRFDVAGSPSLPDEVKQRVGKLAGRRLTTDGVLVIQARRFRSQGRNRTDAVDRLVDLLRRAAARPKPRRKTKPTAASKRRRLDGKRKRAATKQQRRNVSPDAD